MGYRLLPPVEEEQGGRSGPARRSCPVDHNAHGGDLARFVGAAFCLGVLGLGLVLSWSWLTQREEESILEIDPLTSSPGRELDPAISPDGSRVAYAWIEEPGDTADIYLRLLEREEGVRITREVRSDRSPAWSPDGRQIAFLRYGGPQP